MDNKTLRATLLIGGHGYGVIQLLSAVKETAGLQVSIGYSMMAIGPGLGLMFAWTALTWLGHEEKRQKKPTAWNDPEFWLGLSTYLMFITIYGIIVSVWLFWA
ncbi:MAG: hypothetical protein KBG84_17000 [Planctomycetes bacterium]|nr:hypothetical protein [Planctomycetota bacterium]